MIIKIKEKLPILVYCNIGIGIQAFIIKSYLYKAKIENRKLLLINLPDFRPYYSFFKLKKKNNNQIYLIESPYILFSKNLIIRKSINFFFSLVFLLMHLFSSIYNFISKKLTHRIIIKKELFQYKNYTNFYNLRKFNNYIYFIEDRYFWEEIKNFDFELNLNYDKTKHTIKQLNKIGLPEKAWFVCVHVRGDNFYNASTDSINLRNANIENFILAFKEITNAGGYIVRIGDNTMEKIDSNNPKIIDYAHSEIKNDFTDLYLIKNCRYYLGTISGPLEVARLFNKPVALTNIYHSSHWYPQAENCIGIMKKIKFNGINLNVEEIFNLYLNIDPIDFFNWQKLNSKIEYIENTNEEILDLVIEMNYFLSTNKIMSDLQKNINLLIEDVNTKILNKEWFINDTGSKYQWFVWNTNIKGRLAYNFLKNNL